MIVSCPFLESILDSKRWDEEGKMIKLFDSDKETLLATIRDCDIDLMPNSKINRIDSYEVKRFCSHGAYSDLTASEIISDTLTHEYRFVRIKTNNYYLLGTVYCFSCGDDCAKFAVECAMGNDK